MTANTDPPPNERPSTLSCSTNLQRPYADYSNTTWPDLITMQVRALIGSSWHLVCLRQDDAGCPIMQSKYMPIASNSCDTPSRQPMHLRGKLSQNTFFATIWNGTGKWGISSGVAHTSCHLDEYARSNDTGTHAICLTRLHGKTFSTH